MERKIHLRENWLRYLEIWGEVELILRIWGAKENTFKELRNFLSGIRGDQCIIFRDQGSTEPPGGLISKRNHFNLFFSTLGRRQPKTFSTLNERGSNSVKMLGTVFSIAICRQSPTNSNRKLCF